LSVSAGSVDEERAAGARRDCRLRRSPIRASQRPIGHDGVSPRVGPHEHRGYVLANADALARDGVHTQSQARLVPAH